MGEFDTIKSGKFEYIDQGEGTPLIMLHGLMGNLNNFGDQLSFFPEKGFRTIMPRLPLYDLPLRLSTVKQLTMWVKELVDHLELDQVTLMGNSLGGHIALMFQKMYPERTAGMILAGSSGLYESAMGTSFPRRGDRNYIAERVRDVFEVKEVATEELIDFVFETVGDRNKAIKTLSISKSAIRHNMSNDLGALTKPALIIWGRQDAVTPPDVADKFNELLPDSELHWIDHCGHAPMMEHPDTFNEITLKWMKERIQQTA